MKKSELREQSESELGSQLLAMNEELATKRFDVSLNRLPRVREIRSLRRSIARIRTILKERSSSGEAQRPQKKEDPIR